MTALRIFALIAAVFATTACQSMYYQAMEGVGVHKREIMVDRIEAARESQEEGQQQFQTALEQFRSVVSVKGGNLEEQYEKLNASYKDSEAQAKEISSRIDKVEHVSQALFDEWKAELEQYKSLSLKQASQKRLRDTQRQYATLMSAMRRAEKSIQPVLTVLKDNTLFLKHNLNAAAIGSIQGELDAVDRNVQQLMRRMEVSIAESNAFIAQLRGE